MNQSIELSADLLYKGLQTYRFTSDDISRSYLTCIKIIVDKASLRLVATDGHAMAIFDTKIDYDDINFVAYVAGSDAKTIAAQLKKIRNEAITVTRMDNGNLEIRSCNLVFTTIHNEDYENFPSYEKVIPTKADKHCAYFGISVVEFERISSYLKAITEPKKKDYTQPCTVIDTPSDPLDPIMFRVARDDYTVRVIQMPYRVTQ